MKSLWLIGTLSLLTLSACFKQPEPYNYSAFKESRPQSILVLPPVNESPDVNAVNGFLSQSTLPLAESGYYVFPVAVVQHTFQQNGLNTPDDIHQVSLQKLSDIFGADAVLYLKVKEYGTSYQLINSQTKVSAEALLLDAHSGKELWKGSASASNDSSQGSNNLLGALISAAVNQVINTVSDKGYDMAGVAANRLLSAGTSNGILYGPRSPHYQQDGNSQ